jgi:hypothetical protein
MVELYHIRGQSKEISGILGVFSGCFVAVSACQSLGYKF